MGKCPQPYLITRGSELLFVNALCFFWVSNDLFFIWQARHGFFLSPITFRRNKRNKQLEAVGSHKLLVDFTSKSTLKLVGGLEHFIFSHILGIIIPIDQYFSEGWLNHQPGKKCGDFAPWETFRNDSAGMFIMSTAPEKTLILATLEVFQTSLWHTTMAAGSGSDHVLFWSWNYCMSYRELADWNSPLWWWWLMILIVD